MKIKLTFFYIFLLLSCNLFAQYAIIKDNDGYVNVRNEAKKGNNISDKLENGFVVYGFQPDNNWVGIDYSKNNKDRSGYVYKDRIKYLSEFTKIPLIKETPSKVIFQKDSLNIILESKKFDPKTAQLAYLKNDKSILEKINGKKIWGADGNIPRTTYKLITVTIGNKTIDFPKHVFDDLFEPSFSDTEINYDKKEDILYISSMNGDGAGGYVILWIIEKGKYKERKISYGF
ncbi:SH3 domain-containing protein [Flavobacterium chungangense]|uniref:SH3b domain-containing protein n=1 Tax=Flavobacterium chungangense TaxID=554283 RepID=A0A6V6Z7L6_9FLAO|nr:hypothetical protein [Flavobacterium chungangense]CAD0007434.1 hypothetical protein FLACHUCJ7_03295 [Flavobacterium chungangense]